MDLLKMGAQLFMNKLGSQGGGMDLGQVTGALSGLLPTSDGELDLAGLIGQMNSGGLSGLAASFLGDGDNDAMSAGSVMDMFGESNIQDFALKLNLDKDHAAEGLSSMIPDLVNQKSEGGSLLKSVGGSMLSGIGSKLFD